MKTGRSRVALCGALALCAVVGAGSGTAVAKRADNGDSRKTAIEKVSNVPIADRAPGSSAPNAFTNVEFKIGNRYRHSLVGKVVLIAQVTGAAPGYLSGFRLFRLISPQGRTSSLISPFAPLDPPNQSFGPFTQTPNSPNQICFLLASCTGAAFEPDTNVFQPWVGTAGNLDLLHFYGGKMRGTWILRMVDSVNGDTGVLNSAILRVKPLRFKRPTVRGGND